MKKDILFIILVLIAGLTGFFYTNRSTDDILVEKKTQLKQGPAAANKNTDINYKTKIATTSAVYDADITEELIDAAQADVEAAIEDTPKLDAPEVVEDPKTWSEIFDHWKLVLIDNTTVFTKISEINLGDHCVVELIWTNKVSRQFSVDKSLNISIKYKDLRLDPDGRDNDFLLKRLRNPNAVALATQKLINFCTQEDDEDNTDT